MGALTVVCSGVACVLVVVKVESKSPLELAIVVVTNCCLEFPADESGGDEEDRTGILRRPAAVAATAAFMGSAGEKEVGDEVAALVRVKKFALVLSGGNLEP